MGDIVMLAMSPQFYLVRLGDWRLDAVSNLLIVYLKLVINYRFVDRSRVTFALVILLKNYFLGR